MGDQQMHVALWDKDVGSKDDYICEGNINLNQVFTKKNFSNWFPVNRKGKPAGQIMIAFEFHGDKPKNKNKNGMGMGMGMPQQGYGQPGMMPQ